METLDIVNEREDDSGIESTGHETSDSAIYVRISVPELKIQVRENAASCSSH